MKPEEIRAAMGAITAKLDGIEAVDGEYTEEQVAEVKALSEEFEKLSAQLETAEKMEAMKAKATASQGRKTQASTPNDKAVVTVGKTLNEKFGGFESSGAWLMAVKQAGRTGEVDKRLLAATIKESVGEDGGFLVPEEISTAILKKMEGDESLMFAPLRFRSAATP